MTPNAWMPILVVLSSMLPGLMIFLLSETQKPLRILLNLLGVFATLFLVVSMLAGVYGGEAYETRLPFLPHLDLVLRAGPLALLFATLSSFLWFLTTVYAIGYLEGSAHSSRFFGFFSLC
ncbi:MAG: hypothetical protein P8Y65_00980, partial [Campylobacterales bacterium]